MSKTELITLLSKHHLYASEDGGTEDACQCGHDLTDGGLLPNEMLIESVHDAHLADVIRAARTDEQRS